MCRYKYVDYVHVYAECLFQTSTHTERTPARARGRHTARKSTGRRRPGRGPARANAATQLPLVSEICPFVIKATSFECLMYFLKIKFIFRNEAFPVFHYQQFKKKIHSHKLFRYFCHSSSQLMLFTFFFSEGKYQAHSGSNCTLKPEC